MFDKENSLTESAFLIRLPLALLSLRGKDCVDFVQRLSTNDVKGLSLYQTQTTILVTERAKIIDVATIIVLENELLLLLQLGKSETTQKWLNKFLFTEDVNIRDVSSEYDFVTVVGSQSVDVIQRLLPQFNVSENRVFQLSLELNDGFVVGDALSNNTMFHVLTRKNQQERLINELRSTLPSTEPDSDVYESFRIENGIPKFGFELTEQVNPLEAGLERFISWTKGCYIGQEVVARIDTYKKLQRRLAGFLFDGTERKIFKPGKIYLQGDEVGWTTSHAWSEKFNNQIALGYLRTSVETDVVEFRENETDSSVQVRISPLPFSV